MGAVERFRSQLLDWPRLAQKIERLAGAAGRGEKEIILRREAPFGEKLEHNPPHRAGRPHDSHLLEHDFRTPRETLPRSPIFAAGRAISNRLQALEYTAGRQGASMAAGR